MKVNLRIPTTLNDIKLSKYQRFVEETKDIEDNDVINRKTISIFCDIDESLVGKMKKSDYDNTINIIAKALEEKPEFVQRFKMNGIDYGFIPKLDDITLDEQADIDSLLKDVKTFNKAAAVMYRPITVKKRDTYLIEEYKGDGNSLDVPLNVILGAIDFFLNLRNDLLNYTLNYIGKEAVKDKKIYHTLQLNGVGIKTITDLRKGISLNSMMSVS
tara:strand:- start:525 stop:1169 length:645 start_codon:yes stop_codon:yes gene_type:complete